MTSIKNRPIFEMSITIIKDQMSINLQVPHKWLGVIIASVILLRAPELWKAIETAFSLIGK